MFVEAVFGATELAADVEILVAELAETTAVCVSVLVAVLEFCAAVFWLPEWFAGVVWVAAGVWIGWAETPSKIPAVSCAGA